MADYEPKTKVCGDALHEIPADWLLFLDSVRFPDSFKR